MKKFNIIERFKILLHKLCHEYEKRIYKTAMPYIMLSSYYSLETKKGLILCYKTVNNEYNNGETIQI